MFTLGSVGVIVSILKSSIFRSMPAFPAASVIKNWQLLYVQCVNAFNVTVLLHAVAAVVAEEQAPDRVIVPASSVVKL